MPDNYEAKVKLAAMELNSIPWWRIFKRREAGDNFKAALYQACLNEMDEHVASGKCEGGDKCPLKLKSKP